MREVNKIGLGVGSTGNLSGPWTWVRLEMGSQVIAQHPNPTPILSR